jgi:drug/metabolite transporter (DMT)-like permease
VEGQDAADSPAIAHAATAPPPPRGGPPPPRGRNEGDPPLRFGLTALLIGNICLSFGPWFVRLSDTGPVAAAFWRMALAAPLLFTFAKIAGAPAQRLSRPMLILFFVSGLFFAADLASWHLGIGSTKLANSNLLGNAASFLLPLYGFIIARQWPDRTQAMALALAIAGAALLIGRSFELSPENFKGDLLCLLAGIFYTIYLVFMGNIRDSLAAWPTLAWTSLSSVLPLLALSWAMNEQLIPHNWTPLIALAFFSQIAGQGLMIYAVGRVSPLLLGITLLTQPAIAAAIGWFVYHEALSPADWAGAALIGLAMVLVRKE